VRAYLMRDLGSSRLGTMDDPVKVFSGRWFACILRILVFNCVQ